MGIWLLLAIVLGDEPPPRPAAEAPTPSLRRAIETADLAQWLGEGWKENFGFRIDDVARIPEDYEGSVREAAERLARAARGIGAVAFAEVSFARTAAPLDQITLRIFIFETEARATAHRVAKYESEAAAPLYERTEKDGRITFDSRELKKRIVFDGRIWITASQLRGEGQHETALEKILVSLVARREMLRKGEEPRETGDTPQSEGDRSPSQ